MTYADIRQQINSGDVLGVRGQGLFPSITRNAFKGWGAWVRTAASRMPG